MILPRSVLAFLLASSLGQAATLTVQVRHPGAALNPAMWGAFFEDINFGADGGLYAELVKNRGFEFPDPMMGWIRLSPSLAKGELSVRTDDPFDPDNPHYIRLRSEGTAPFGLSNEGFRGIGLRQGETYDFSMRIRAVSGTPRVSVRLYGNDGTVLDEAILDGLPASWGRRTAELHPSDTDAHARLAVLVIGRGTVDVDFISLFPRHTWKDRPGGLRADLVQALADLHPGFLRFPGGCIVEGSVLSRRYQWKHTLGPVEKRHVLVNRWNYEFLHRPTPDYYQSFGLGFYEYFQLCEDLGAQPLPILNCGMACQFNSGELCGPGDIDHYVQDALDLAEFATGGIETPWGARRAALGHPAPFRMTLLGVGNEQWGLAYFERFAAFAKAFHARYPGIALVAAAGPSPDDIRFRLAWKHLPALGANLMDEHCYAPPEWFLDHTHRYDRYDRSGPGVFMGEYAAQSVETVSPKNRNTLGGAVAEAAYMLGMERNADVVRMASYAPLFAHRDAWQWTPDLVWFDNLRVVRTADYYVQQLFARNVGTRVLPVAVSGTDAAERRRVYASAVRDDASGTVIVKVVNALDHPERLSVDLGGSTAAGGTLTLLSDSDPGAFNTFDHPDRIHPRVSPVPASAGPLPLELPAHAFAVLRVRPAG